MAISGPAGGGGARRPRLPLLAGLADRGLRWRRRLLRHLRLPHLEPPPALPPTNPASSRGSAPRVRRLLPAACSSSPSPCWRPSSTPSPSSRRSPGRWWPRPVGPELAARRDRRRLPGRRDAPSPCTLLVAVGRGATLVLWPCSSWRLPSRRAAGGGPPGGGPGWCASPPVPCRQRPAHRVGCRGRLLRHPDPGVGLGLGSFLPWPCTSAGACARRPARGARVGRAGAHRVRRRHLRRVDGLPGVRRAGAHAGSCPRPRGGRRRHPVVSGAAFGARPSQQLGDVSYSVYLWHWPVVVLVPYALTREMTDVEKVVAVAAVIAVSVLTKRFVEDPVAGRAGCRPASPHVRHPRGQRARARCRRRRHRPARRRRHGGRAAGARRRALVLGLRRGRGDAQRRVPVGHRGLAPSTPSVARIDRPWSTLMGAGRYALHQAPGLHVRGPGRGGARRAHGHCTRATGRP